MTELKFENMTAAASGDSQNMLGKLLYFSLPSVLVDKDDLRQLCVDMNIPYAGGNRLSVSDAFRSATGDVRDRIISEEYGERRIYQIYCRDNRRISDSVISRELVKETMHQETNQYEKLANISYDKDSQIFSYDNLAYLVCGCCGNRLVKGKASNKNWRCASARYVAESGCAEVCISDADLQAILIRAINMQCQLRDARLETYQRQFESHASKRRAINARMQRVQAEIHRKQEELMSLYEAHVGGRLSKESFTEKRESLLCAQNEKKRQLAQLESDWELLCAEEETAKKEERQTSVLSPYHEISALDPALMRELVCEILVFHRRKIQINWKFHDFASEFVE